MIVGLIQSGSGPDLISTKKTLRTMPMHQRARIGLGYLPQEASVFRKLSVEKNIMAILQTRPELDRADRERILEELLDELHIHHVRTASASACRVVSAGVSRFAREHWRPNRDSSCWTNRLPASTRYRYWTSSASSGISPPGDIGVLITDHNVRETLGICGRAYILSDGVMIAQGSPDEILSDQQVREVYLGENFSL